MRLLKLNESVQQMVIDEMISTADDLIYNCDRRTYYGVGSPSPMPFEDNIIINNLLSGYTLKAYALLGTGKYNEAEEYIEKAKKIYKYDFRVFAFEQIKNTII